MKGGRRVEFVIDELVLHGFPPSEREAIGAALRGELERLVAAGDISALAGLGDASSLRAANISLQPGARPEAIGNQVARAVHGSLVPGGKGGGR